MDLYDVFQDHVDRRSLVCQAMCKLLANRRRSSY